jgi:excisionase family DNA binding protein
VSQGKIAYSVEEAAAAVGYSDWTIRQAIKNHELFPRYAGRKAVILHDDLYEWVANLPLEPPEKEDKR